MEAGWQKIGRRSGFSTFLKRKREWEHLGAAEVERRPQNASTVQSEETFLGGVIGGKDLGTGAGRNRVRRMALSFVMEEVQERKSSPVRCATSA